MPKHDRDRQPGQEKGEAATKFNWQEKVLTALIAAVIGGLVSYSASYYTHGREIATLEAQIASVKEQLNALQAKISAPAQLATRSPDEAYAPPKVEITSLPEREAAVQRPPDARNKACFFNVGGNSSNVESNNNLDLYVLVHPHGDPYWYIQDDRPSFGQNGGWHALAWVGNENESPKDGDTFDVAAVVAEPARVASINEKRVKGVKDLSPKAQSVIDNVVVKLPK